MLWLFYFLFYSFLGFCLEVVFARLTHDTKLDRKCFLFLPLCPMYGLGAIGILLLPQWVRQAPLQLLLWGGVLATATEYATGLFYEKAVGVSFWNYAHLPFHIGGKVCLLFSGGWGVLAAVFYYTVQPWVGPLLAGIPHVWGGVALAVFTLDSALTLAQLITTGTTESLKWYAPKAAPVPALFPSPSPWVETSPPPPSADLM